MLNIYICEDDDKQRERVQQLICEMINLEQLDMRLELATDNPITMIEHVKKDKRNGIFFLDVDLKQKMNGLELAMHLRNYQPRCYIIFITSHSEMFYMTFTYKVEAMDYIIKDDYQGMKNRILQCLLYIQELNIQKQDSNKAKFFSVKAGSKIQAIPYDDILFFEVSSTPHKLILHTKEAMIEFMGKIKDLEKELDTCFYRCHRSCIVNKSNIEVIDKGSNVIKLKGGLECPMSVRLGKGL